MIEFKPVRKLGTWLQWLLLGQIVTTFLSFTVTIFSITIFRQVVFEEVEPTGTELVFLLAFIGVVLLNFLLYFATAILFMVWLARAYGNLEGFHVNGRGYSPHWAYWSWIVPILNLFVPFKMVMETRNGSDPSLGTEIHRQADGSYTGYHLTWWILWIAAIIISNASVRMSFSEDNKIVEFSSYLDIISLLLTMPCAYLAYEIVKEITENQTTLLQQYMNAEPPKPEVFEGMK